MRAYYGLRRVADRSGFLDIGPVIFERECIPFGSVHVTG